MVSEYSSGTGESTEDVGDGGLEGVEKFIVLSVFRELDLGYIPPLGYLKLPRIVRAFWKYCLPYCTSAWVANQGLFAFL